MKDAQSLITGAAMQYQLPAARSAVAVCFYFACCSAYVEQRLVDAASAQCSASCRQALWR